MSDNIIQLASVNNSVEPAGAAAQSLVVAFLREWADAIETGAETADKAVLILHETREASDDTEMFCVKVRRCNTNTLEQAGLMHLALADLALLT